MNNRFIGLLSIIIGLILSITIMLSIFTALPDNPVSDKLKYKEHISVIYPQNWGFYSKNPRDETFLILDSTTFKNGAAWPNNISENLFGIYRKGRAQGTEMGLLSNVIPPDKWENCTDKYKKCIQKNKEKVLKIKNPTPKPNLCGKLTFIKKEPVPWAWKKNNPELVMPSKIVRLDIVC